LFLVDIDARGLPGNVSKEGYVSDYHKWLSRRMPPI
jgi:hypothetical protein